MLDAFGTCGHARDLGRASDGARLCASHMDLCESASICSGTCDTMLRLSMHKPTSECTCQRMQMVLPGREK